MKRTLLVSLPTLLTVLVLGMQTGCGPSGPDIDTFPVTGVVKLNGVPVEGALVSFVADEGGKYSPAGTTDMMGKYTLNTMGVDGAPTGSYKVKILKQKTTEAAPTAPAPTGAGGMPPDENEEDDPTYAGDEGEPVEEAGNMLPAKYASETTSGLTAVVKEGENTFDFDMN